MRLRGVAQRVGPLYPRFQDPAAQQPEQVSGRNIAQPQIGEEEAHAHAGDELLVALVGVAAAEVRDLQRERVVRLADLSPARSEIPAIRTSQR